MEGGLDLGLKLLHDNHLVLEDVLPDHLVQIHQTMKKAVLEVNKLLLGVLEVNRQFLAVVYA